MLVIELLLGVYRARKKNATSLIYEPYIQVLGIFKSGKSFEDYKPTEEDEKNS